MIVNQVGFGGGGGLFHGRGGDELALWVTLVESFGELREAAGVAAGFVELILVADLDEVQGERRGVAIFGALGAPARGGVTGDVLDFVKRGLHKGLERGPGGDVLAFERIARVDGEHGLDLQVLAPFEEFEQTHAVGGPVGPGRLVAGTVYQRADGLLPVVPILECVAFEVVAAGQAQELRMQGGHALHQVGAVAVGAVVEGGWEE